MTARRNYYGPAWAVGGPGAKPGAAPAGQAASRMASAAGPTPDSVGNEAGEPVTSSREPATSAVLGEERERGAASLPGEPGVDGAGQDGQAEPEVEFDLEALVAKAEQADAYLELARRTKA